MPPQLQRTSWSLASLTPHPVTLSPSLLQSILPVFLTKALILLLVLQERLIRKVNCQFGGYISSGQSSPSQILTWAEFQRHIIKWVGSAALPCKRIGLAMASSDAEHIHVQKSEEEWRAVLSPEQFRILRQKGTELKGTGEYNKFYEDGLYKCAGCGTPLYKSTTKFDSGCGWPAFYEGLPGAINRNVDADGRRTEITCAACGGHLGHVFKGEGFQVPTDERHCVNSVSIKFIPAN